MVLGILFNVNGTLWNLCVAVVTAKTAHRIRESRRAVTWINRPLGAMFVYLGVRVAMNSGAIDYFFAGCA